MIAPKSCDTFSVLPSGTLGDCVIFGKNSDRPSNEVQEIIYVPQQSYSFPSKLKCTYIEIDQVAETYAVVLSKPAWMWGAEMGANEHNVCIGNEAVWTKLNGPNDSKERLLGMDLLRLGLERASSALEALDVITMLLKQYGMGGNCSETLRDFTYHNSFLIADPSEVWILECAGDIWAAERVVTGVRNISNELSVSTKIDRMSDDLESFAASKKFWKSSDGPLNFKKAYGDVNNDDDSDGRYASGQRLLERYSKDGNFKQTDMFKVLRDKSSGICMSSGSFVSTGSQVSVLRKPESGFASCHFFTCTPDPSCSVFKPFIFTDDIQFPLEVISPVFDSVEKVKPSDRKHELYKVHEVSMRKQNIGSNILRVRMQEFESYYVSRAEEVAEKFKSMKTEASRLFLNAVKDEMVLYASI